VFMLIHQLAREVWWYESRFPLSAIGYVVEPLYLRCYARSPVLTISASTERDLRQLGFSGPITVIPLGAELVGNGTPKESIPTFVFVGRLYPSKRVSHIIRAFAIFRRANGPARLWLIGKGERMYVRKLGLLAERLGLKSDVRFWGWVEPNQKQDLVARSHMLLMASVREGWGLTVSEANACGTPAVAYDVPGLRDAVQHEVTGLLSPPSPEALSAAMSRLWRDQTLYTGLAEQARSRASQFSLDHSASVFRGALARYAPDDPQDLER
jgi:glycosyltransferase involved in cell wall biosynthesis